MTVNNIPTYAKNYKYIVARAVSGELWFYGAYSTSTKAYDVAEQIDGIVIIHEDL